MPEQEYKPELLERRQTPVEIVEAAIVNGDIVIANSDARDALHMVLAAARQNQTLHERLEARDAEVDALTERNELDDLTMTYNRSGFMRRFEEHLQLIESGNRATDPRALIVLMLDSDDFKLVNDTHGHPVGDGLLWEIGGALWLSVRADDTVARMGGDEFALLLPVTRGDGETIHEDAVAVLGDVVDRLGVVVDRYNESTADPTLHIKLSAGAAIYKRGDAWTAEQVLANADLALYSAKHHGKGRTILFDEQHYDELAEGTEIMPVITAETEATAVARELTIRRLAREVFALLRRRRDRP